MYSIGIDVSKAKLDCSVLLDPQTLKFKTKVVPNSRAGVTALLLWCRKQGIEAVALHAILEGTGVYHEQAAEALHEAGVSVSVVNPARVRNFAHGLSVLTKTDGVDARVLARFGLLTQPAIWSPPSREARMLQALLTRREALMQELQRELNRQEKAQATQTPPPILHSLQESIAFLRAQLAKLQHELDDHIGTHPELKEDQALLQSIPGVGPQVSMHLLAIMKRHTFRCAEQLAAYLGLIPIERQSGSSVLGRARLSKAGPALIRAKLYMAAIVATRCNPHVKAVYEQLRQRGKAAKAALCAAMRKLVHLCFGVIKNRTPYRADFSPNRLTG